MTHPWRDPRSLAATVACARGAPGSSMRARSAASRARARFVSLSSDVSANTSGTLVLIGVSGRGLEEGFLAPRAHKFHKVEGKPSKKRQSIHASLLPHDSPVADSALTVRGVGGRYGYGTWEAARRPSWVVASCVVRRSQSCLLTREEQILERDTPLAQISLVPGKFAAAGTCSFLPISQ